MVYCGRFYNKIRSVVGLWCFHTYLTCSNTTTNEDMKGTWKKKEWLNSESFCVKSEIDSPLGLNVCEKSNKYARNNINFKLDDPNR